MWIKTGDSVVNLDNVDLIFIDESREYLESLGEYRYCVNASFSDGGKTPLYCTDFQNEAKRFFDWLTRAMARGREWIDVAYFEDDGQKL